MTTTSSTDRSVSEDSGELWTVEGAWEVASGLHRIPLPLPMDGLRAVNVYVLEHDRGLTLIDGGWAIPEAREVFERSLRLLGAGFGDITSFLVTHMHRDHYSMARVLGTELGIQVSMGLEERPGLDALQQFDQSDPAPFVVDLVACGAPEVAEQWAKHATAPDQASAWWSYPDTWLGEGAVDAGGRELRAVHTPGHTPGHYVFVDEGARSLFAGDHVLPTITPSIGFIFPPPRNPLGDFLRSLVKVRTLPDLRVLPAHGPIAPSSHARVDELLEHHEHRLDQCLEAISSGELTVAQVAGQLAWTRHERDLTELDAFNKGMAILETHAHLEVLVARAALVESVAEDGLMTYGTTGMPVREEAP